MAVTTGAPDEEPEDRMRTWISRVRQARIRRLLSDEEAPGSEAFDKLLDTFKIADHLDLSSVHVHDPVVRLVASGGRETEKDRDQAADTLAEQRQQFYFDFLKQSLKQAGVTFWLSVVFMGAGAVVILVGAVLALVYAQSADLSYVPLVTALTGTLITVGGGALALHARRAKAHVTEQAERIGDKADKDDGLQTTLKLIDQVSDRDLRDRIRTAVALQALGVTADPETIASSLLTDPRGEIEPGDSKP